MYGSGVGVGFTFTFNVSDWVGIMQVNNLKSIKDKNLLSQIFLEVAFTPIIPLLPSYQCCRSFFTNNNICDSRFLCYMDDIQVNYKHKSINYTMKLNEFLQNLFQTRPTRSLCYNRQVKRLPKGFPWLYDAVHIKMLRKLENWQKKFKHLRQCV